jgi:co-chaperonin GroES (HSP10)
MMKIRPLPGRVFCIQPPFPKDLRMSPDAKIILPRDCELLTSWAHRRMLKIVALGDDCDPELEVGQYVVTGHFSGSDATYDGVDYIVLLEGELSAILPEADDDTMVF